MNQTDAILAVRDFVDQIYYDLTDVMTNADIEASGASRFSNHQIGEFIESGCRYIASRVRSDTLEEWMTPSTPPAIPGGAIRLAEASVVVGAVPAVRRSYKANRNLVASGRAPTNAYPAYAYSDCEWTVFGTTENPAGSTGEFVTIPVPEAKRSLCTINTGVATITLTPGAPPNNDTFGSFDVGAFGVMTGSVTPAVDTDVLILTVGGSTTGTVTPTPQQTDTLVPISWIIPSINKMDDRLSGAIVARAAELMFAAQERLDMSGIAKGYVAERMAAHQLGASNERA